MSQQIHPTALVHPEAVLGVDVVIGARYASPGGDSKAGESFVLFGPGYAANPLDARLLSLARIPC